MGEVLYDDGFYDEIDAMSRRSASSVVPWVMEWLSPASVLDVGCGRGTWLAAFKQAGVTDVLGLDGHHVDRSSLHIAPEEFEAVDLVDPPSLTRTFDLVMSVEVAEHLPASSADAFVAWLTTAGSVVLFSAAIPGQGGVHHVNEQWPGYWATRFERCGFRPLDAVRPRFWADDRVEFYFAQNLLLYVRDDHAHDVEARLGPLFRAEGGVPSLVHPGMLEAVRSEASRRHRTPPSLSSLVRALPAACRKAIASRWPARRT